MNVRAKTGECESVLCECTKTAEFADFFPVSVNVKACVKLTGTTMKVRVFSVNVSGKTGIVRPVCVNV